MREPIRRRRREAPDIPGNDHLQADLVLFAQVPGALHPASAAPNDAGTEPGIRVRYFERDQRIALHVILRAVFAAVATDAERCGDFAERLAERVDSADRDRDGGRDARAPALLRSS